MSFEEVVPRKEDEARGFRLCFRGDDGAAAAGTSVVTRSYISTCLMSRDLVGQQNVSSRFVVRWRTKKADGKKDKGEVFY